MHAITLERVAFSYTPGFPTLQAISFGIAKGEFLGLAGPNGSGKTTLLRLIDRIYVPDQGTIMLEGRDISSYQRADLARRVAFVPQETALVFPFTSLELVLMGRAPHIRGRLFESGRDRDIALRMLALMDVESLADRSVTSLSGGERQRVLIARALAQEPSILLLDEPTSHLDIAHQIEMFDIMTMLKKTQGLTVVSVSHDLNLAAAYSDRIALLNRGAVVAIGEPAAVLTASRIREVFGVPVLVDTHPAFNSLRITLIPQHHSGEDPWHSLMKSSDEITNR